MITLDSLHISHSEAYKELVAMEPDVRIVMLDWLNGRTTSPKGYGIADREYIKEDARVNVLKVLGVDFVSKKVSGGRHVHYMSEELINEYLNDRETMKKRVVRMNRAKKERRRNQMLLKLIEDCGATSVIDRVHQLAAKLTPTADGQ